MGLDGTEDASGPRSRAMDREGCPIRAWESGPQHGPVVVLTHGASMDHRMFDPQVPSLAAAGYRVVTWDMRGHGESQPMGRPPHDVGDLTEDLLALLDALGIAGPVCIGGQSLGGYVAQEFYLRSPERVSAMVIIGSTNITMPIPRHEQWALRSSAWWFVPWPWGHLQRTVARSTAIDPGVRAYAASAIGRMSKRDFIMIWKALARSMHSLPAHRITVPLLLTHGELDRTGNIARTAPGWAARDPEVRYEVIPGASHNANQDRPELFTPLLLEFLAQHHPTGGPA